MDGVSLPALVASHAGVWIAGPNGRTSAVSRGEAIRRAADTPHLLLNAPVTASRLGYPELSGLDLLELFAFIHPARFAVPTANGLATALGLEPPAGESDAAFLARAATALIDTADDPQWPQRHGAWAILQSLARQRWPWAPLLAPRLRRPAPPERSLFTTLPKWEETAPRPAPKVVTLDDYSVNATLDTMLGPGAEQRAGQRAYAHAASAAFQPRRSRGAPNMVLAEAGTGIGKTLGYLAPATDRKSVV